MSFFQSLISILMFVRIKFALYNKDMENETEQPQSKPNRRRSMNTDELKSLTIMGEQLKLVPRIYQELKEMRQEMNGRLRAVEIKAITNETKISNLKEDVDDHSKKSNIWDGILAISTVIGTIIGSLFGNK